jgi:hypothetical protein
MHLKNLTLPPTGGVLVVGRGVVTFFNIAETSGAAAAKVTLWDGEGTSGQVLANIVLLSATSKENAPGLSALPFEHGIYAQVVSGAVAGNIAVRLAESEAEWGALMKFVGASS